MNDSTEIFKNEEFGKIRIEVLNGNPWFVGKDVAVALCYKDTDQALRKHVDAEDKQTRQIDGLGQRRRFIMINESGLYALIFGSKLESAKRFKRWVTAEVLPAIRKMGSYDIKGEAKVLPQTKEAVTVMSKADEKILAYNRGIVLGVFRHELEEDSTLEIFERLSARGKGIVMKMIFGEVRV